MSFSDYDLQQLRERIDVVETLLFSTNISIPITTISAMIDRMEAAERFCQIRKETDPFLSPEETIALKAWEQEKSE